MRLFVAAATAIAALSSCTFDPVAKPHLPAPAAAPAEVRTPTVSLETMRAALPAFDLRAAAPGSAQEGEISVVRDLTFTEDSSILTRDQVLMLAPLQAYLRANSTVAVRIEGRGDGLPSAEQEANLGRDRAQAVARALLTDMRVSNAISAVAAAAPRLGAEHGNAKITFVLP